MTKYLTQFSFSLLGLAMLIAPAAALAFDAGTLGAPQRGPLLVNPEVTAQPDEIFRGSAGFQEANQYTIGEVVANVIRTVVGLVGLIFVSLMVAGGLMWMSSAGNEERVSRAKKIMVAGIVGLVITLSAYAITYLVLATIFTPAISIDI